MSSPRKWILSSVLYLVLFILLSTVSFSAIHGTTLEIQLDENISTFLASVARFLASQYVPEVSLLRAATYARPDAYRIYIASDNLLASQALIVLGIVLHNDTLYRLGTDVSKSMWIYVEKLCRDYGWCTPFDEKHEVILGFPTSNSIPTATRTLCFAKVFSVKLGRVLEICTEVPTRIPMPLWRVTADLIVYRALNLVIRGRYDEARNLFLELLTMWDGYGFRDAVQNATHIYDTYKVGLALYLCRILDHTPVRCPAKRETIEKWIEILLEMQRGDGGIVTNYRVENSKIVPVGDANVETSSIAALALTPMPTLFIYRAKMLQILWNILEPIAAVSPRHSVAYLESP